MSVALHAAGVPLYPEHAAVTVPPERPHWSVQEQPGVPAVHPTGLQTVVIFIPQTGLPEQLWAFTSTVVATNLNKRTEMNASSMRRNIFLMV
jgi:hypothetical protein